MKINGPSLDKSKKYGMILANAERSAQRNPKTHEERKMTTEQTNKATRVRRSAEERLKDLQAKMDALKAKMAGTYDETKDSNYTTKRLGRMIARRETAISVANVLLNGKAATEKSPAVASLTSKIERAEAHLKTLRENETRALELLARVPSDIDTLRALLASAQAGNEIVFPTDLFVIPAEQSNEEHEAASVVAPAESN